MVVYQLMCDCGALYELHSATPGYPPQVCGFCGGPLMELAPAGFDRPLAASAEGEFPELLLIGGPSQLPVAARVSTDASSTDLDARVADAVTQGIPTLVCSRTRQHAVLMNMTELKRLVSARAVRAQADRQRDPDGWQLVIDQLGVSAHGWTFETAMQALGAVVRERARSVLGDPMAPYEQRDLALRLWVADVEGDLSRLLDDAVELVDTEASPPTGSSPDRSPATPHIDRDKLSAARAIVREDYWHHDRSLDKRILRNQRMLEVSQYEMGLVGEWPDVDQLTTMLHRRGADLDCRDEETFARFDALLNWILLHGRDTAGATE